MLGGEIYDRYGNYYQANTQTRAISRYKELTGIQLSREVIFDYEDGKACGLAEQVAEEYNRYI